MHYTEDLIAEFSTHKVEGIIIRGALFARHDGVSQSSGGARNGQKLSVAHVGLVGSSADCALGYEKEAWKRECQAIGEWLNTIYAE